MTRDTIAVVAAALGRTASSPVAECPTVPRSGRLEVRDTEMDRLLDEIGYLSGLTRRTSKATIGSDLQSLVGDFEIHKAVVGATPRLMSLGVSDILRDLGVELVSSHADKRLVAECDLGVSEIDLALAETGTLCQYCTQDQPGSISLLPRAHLAIVSPSSLRADLGQVLGEAKAMANPVFITGVSRTADIELVITLGVHGPKHLIVWALDESLG